MRELTDRRAERGVLDGLAQAVRAGESRVLVVHGGCGAPNGPCARTSARTSGCLYTW